MKNIECVLLLMVVVVLSEVNAKSFIYVLHREKRNTCGVVGLTCSRDMQCVQGSGTIMCASSSGGCVIHAMGSHCGKQCACNEHGCFCGNKCHCGTDGCACNK